MTLAQVQAAVGVVLALIGTWTGLMIAVAILFPVQAGKAEKALERSTRACLGAGIGLIFLFGILVSIFQAAPPLLKLISGLALLGLYAVLAFGASGIARLMGRRITDMSGTQSAFGALVKGSLSFSLALGFPLIGWILFAPLAIIFSLGAGAAALRPSRETATPPFRPTNPPDFDISERQGAL